MNYYIFRHGETFFSKFKIPYGIFINVAPILPSKIPVTKRLAEYLKNVPTDANFSSPYLRCKQTIKIIEKVSLKKFVFDTRLGEFHNETINKMEARLTNFLEEIKKKNFQNVMICSHGWPIVCLKDIILKGKLDSQDLGKYPNPGILICIKNGKVKEINFN